MGQTQRDLPARPDLWQPHDPIVDNIINRSLDEAEAADIGSGTSTLMGGAVVLVVLGVMIIMVTRSAAAAVLVPALLGAVGLAYMMARSVGPDPAARRGTLADFGGAGRMPAGYLVHPGAWRAGMAEHVASLPQSQLHAAVALCRDFPGTVDDLLTFTGTVAIHVPPVRNGDPSDVAHRAQAMVRIATPVLRDFIAANPPAELTAGKKGK